MMEGCVCVSQREGGIKEKGEKDEGKGRRVGGEGEGRPEERQQTCWHRTLSNGRKQSLSTVKKNAPDKYLIHQRTPDVLIN